MITIATLIVFLNSAIGCTKMAIRPTEEIVKYPKERIHAVGLHSTFPFKIDLKEVSEVRFSGTKKNGIKDSTVNAAPAEIFEKEASLYEKIKIEGVMLNSGEEINLQDRKSRYEDWAGVITVLGSEIVFADSGAIFDTDGESIRGQTLNGDSVAVKVDDIAYIRRKVTDYTQSLFFVGGLVLTFIALFTGVNSLSSSYDD
ncbi:MAG: hypothetical protein JXA92_02655 [candidate division Zixibacteria bacterium]|nr:hypothetical protein [candidate division Zixibacteria bacterium]